MAGLLHDLNVMTASRKAISSGQSCHGCGSYPRGEANLTALHNSLSTTQTTARGLGRHNAQGLLGSANTTPAVGKVPLVA